MPWYNPRTKQIEGAEPGTLAYFHEKRHAWQDSKKILNLESTFYWFLIPLTIFFLWYYPAEQVKDVALTTLGMHLLLNLGIELDAWAYAFLKTLRW